VRSGDVGTERSMPIQEGCWSAQGPGDGGVMPRCLRSPSPALNSKEHAELAVAATPGADNCPAAHIPVQYPHPHPHPHLPAGKAGTAHGLRSPAQRSWLRRFRTHARLGSFQAFSRTLDASSAYTVHTSQSSGADPSFLTPQEGGRVEESEVTP
jgi:hypothetical protein